jgi:tellurite methyltransferase
MDTKGKWNSKYKERLNDFMEPIPNTRLKNLAPYLMGGTALDLACGLGGNSLFLSQLNYHVEAIDLSDVAVNYLQQLATEQKLSIQPSLADLTDMNSLQLKKNSFDLVVITYYLDRALFPLVKSLIKDNGYFFMETIYLSPNTDNQGVSNQYKLQPGELLEVFRDWNILYYEENQEDGRQTIFCKKVI